MGVRGATTSSLRPAALTRPRVATALAVVMGGLDLVRPLVQVGVRCVIACTSSAAAYQSSLVVGRIPLPEDGDPDVVLERLLAFGQAQVQRPVLFFERDEWMLLISRHREELGRAYRFVIDDAERVEACADKIAFAELADDTGLRVPASWHLRPSLERANDRNDLGFPSVVKPGSHRDPRWKSLAGHRKAIGVQDRDELAALWPRLARTGAAYLLQTLIPGPETRVESYHAYIDPNGEPLGTFTGRKIRTHPARYGQSTAVELTHAPDVEASGRRATRALRLQGVLKVDFKRDVDGTLWLLEVNPRFTLWNRLGALAGVNVPALVYAELTGAPLPEVQRHLAGLTWVHPMDLRAARASGTSVLDWVRWAARCDAVSVLAFDDPLVVPRLVWRRIRSRRGRT